MILSFFAGLNLSPKWLISTTILDAQINEAGELYYLYKKEEQIFQPVPTDQSVLLAMSADFSGELEVLEEIIVAENDQGVLEYRQLSAQKHWGFWSLLPAFCAVLLCWLTREPITALLGGIVSGALLLGLYDLTGEVLIPTLGTTQTAGILILYLWFLGGLLGVWSKSGAALAFAEWMTLHVVRGPRSAKLVAWFLGVIFFQGGTVSTVLVGTTVKPIADKERISHEELAYIVDSTASPIASQLAFNAWPGYVQVFIFVPGVAFLATETDRIAFFFSSVPFCFYAIFAVLGTFLLSIEKPLYLGKRMKSAMNRSRSTGKLDSDDAVPLAAPELQDTVVPKGYIPNMFEFIVPLILLIAIAIGTFIHFGSPNVQWAFGIALLVAAVTSLVRGMTIKELIDGVSTGMKSLLIGSVILLLAITIGAVSSQAGGGTYLVALLGDALPWFLLPVLLQLMTMTIAFSTGTSWGTYAVAFPLAMPLAWAIANGQDLAHPWFFMTLCFAAVMDGSVYGDQCSPISDTTVLSSMCTGCDLMDHVRTQIPQATFAAILAAIVWSVLAFFAGVGFGG
ncbi:MAG: sodium:proton antiporter [Gammaproteobacteria bacterium]|nr:sodium:proton antiporter [Gammaproteobacteria bacterium]MYC26165.1 sodium:proton antiporter [Gammaproteobacteria bacterium]